MRLELIEDEPIALGEVAAAAAVEEERLRVPEGRRNRDVELVLDAAGPEPDVVEPCPMEFSGREEVRQLQARP